MDHRQLVELVKQVPHLWDRNCPIFRDKEAKEKAWNEVANKMGHSASTCREAFKSLREKYLRERDKAQHQGDHCNLWDLLDKLKFLDPHIVPRAVIWNGNSASEDDLSINSDSDPTDFDKQLIQMVRKASPIWDRNSNTYPNKTSKHQLWEHISSTLNRDINSCMLRWKALREKYIRQKAKFQEGEAKWELLDDLVFLDKVIQYRRKHSDLYMSHGSESSRKNYLDHMPGYHEGNSSSNYSYIRCNVDADDYNYTDSSNDFLNIVKEESTVQQVADSSYSSPMAKRQREPSVGSYGDSAVDKKIRTQENPFEKEPAGKSRTERTPEQLFGDLVVSLLSKKPESRRNLYMIDIMTVLSK
ncbi:uncharacterized protein LOC109546904 [Dendroctonus ponderosae]